MLSSRFSKMQRAVSVLVLALVLATSLLWVWHIVGMHEDRTMAMQSCLLAGGRVMPCALNATEQIGLWHTMYAVILPLAAVVTILASVLWNSGTSIRRHLRRIFSTAPPRFLTRRRDWISLEPLRQAFSQGILHPKLYNLA